VERERVGQSLLLECWVRSWQAAIFFHRPQSKVVAGLLRAKFENPSRATPLRSHALIDDQVLRTLKSWLLAPSAHGEVVNNKTAAMRSEQVFSGLERVGRSPSTPYLLDCT